MLAIAAGRTLADRQQRKRRYGVGVVSVEPVVQCVADGVAAVPGYFSEVLTPRVGSTESLREKHLVEALQAELAGRCDGHIAVGRVIPIPGWPSLGRSGVDLAVEGPPRRYPALIEAKWCHSGRDKIYEAIWDLFKMALGLSRPETLASFLVTGAPSMMWRTGFAVDIFEGRQFTPHELCQRMLPWGREPRWLAWDDLLYGGYDRSPDHVPAAIVTEPIVEPVELATASRWTIRAVRVSIADQTPVCFEGGWPLGLRPATARHPKR
jgi:hypothetical protein